MGGKGAVIQLLLLISAASAAPTETILISVNPRRSIHLLDPNFISFTINPTDLLQGKPFGMGSNLTMTMLKALSPGYVRLGGPDTNRYVFRSPNSADLPKEPEEIAITDEHWKRVNDFLQRSGMSVIACLNSIHKTGAHHKWDPRNAMDLVTFSDRQEFNLTWQLGYDPAREEGITGTQLGKDVNLLRNILNAFPRYQHAKIVGPDVKVLHRKEDVDFVLDYLIEAGPSVNAVTWHPRWPHVSAITRSDSSVDSYDFPPDYLEWDRNQLHKLLQRTLLKKPFWISEPTSEHAGSFAEGIIYARRLAHAAKIGVEVVMKKPSLKDVAHPKPEYWVALLHKKTLGRTIIDAKTMSNQSDVSMIVHCTSRGYGQDQNGGATILTVNTNSVEHRAVLRGFPLGHLREEVHHYVLTAGKEPRSIFSQMAYLNGEPLLVEDGRLPELIPKKKRFGQSLVLKLPPYSIGFYVIPKAKVPACQHEPMPVATLDLEDVSPAELLKTTQKGINVIHHINDMLVNSILKPRTSKEVAEVTETKSTESENPSIARKSRQAGSIADLGEELKRRMVEIKDLMGLTKNSLAKSAMRRPESADHDLNTMEQKIDVLAEDLRNAIKSGDDQVTEFGKFLEMSGLKKDFGKVVVDETIQNSMQKIGQAFDMVGRSRNKRDVAKILRKYPLVFEGSKDLGDIERHYKNLLNKHKKATQEKKLPSLDFSKLNRELQEDLLLREITVLEKTEETLREIMKSHLERYEAIEEMMRDELEQMRDEKMAELLEVKTAHDNPRTHPKRFQVFNELFNDDGKVPPHKREADSHNELDGGDSPLETFKAYLKKKRGEMGKKNDIQERLLELRNKFKLELPMPSLLQTTVRTTTTTTPPPEEVPMTRRASEVLKYMKNYIDDISETENNSADVEVPIPSVRKHRRADDEEELDETAEKTVATQLLRRVLDTIFQPKEEEKTFQDPEESEMVQRSGESSDESKFTSNEDLESKPVPLSTPIERQDEHETNQLTVPQLLGTKEEPHSTWKKHQKHKGRVHLPFSQTLGADMEADDATSEFDQKFPVQEASTKSNSEPIQSTEVPTAMEVPSANGHDESDKTASERIDGNETTKTLDETTGSAQQSESRRKREVDTTTSTSAKDNDHVSHTHRQTMARNSIVKKKAASAKEDDIAEDVINLADSAVRLVLDEVVPKAYDMAKDELEDIALPGHLAHLGRIVGNLENMDIVLKNIKKEDQSDHIQKISRRRRNAIDMDDTIVPQNNINAEEPDDLFQTLTPNPIEDHNVETQETPEESLDTLGETENLEIPMHEATTDYPLMDGQPHLVEEKEPMSSYEQEGGTEETATTPGDLTAAEETTMPPEFPKTSAQDGVSASAEMNLEKALQGEPLAGEVLTDVAEAIVRDEMNDKTETAEITSPATPKLANTRMKILRKTDKLKQDHAGDDRYLSGEKNIIALIVDNMLKNHENHKKNVIEEVKRKFKRTALQGVNPLQGLNSLQTLSPVDLPNEPGLSQSLRKLTPGVYVVPAEDMENVRAVQTAKTERGENGKVMPHVVTLNIFYDKKIKDKEGAPKTSHFPSKYSTQALLQPSPNWLPQQPAPMPPQVAPQINLPTFSKPQLMPKFSSQYTVPDPKTFEASSLPNYPDTTQEKQVYTQVYEEPVVKSQPMRVADSSASWASPQKTPYSSVSWGNSAQDPSSTSWAKQPESSANLWKPQQAESATPWVKQPEESSLAWDKPLPDPPLAPPTWSQNYYQQAPMKQVSSMENTQVPWQDQQNVAGQETSKPAAVIKPYWNKTLKQIFQETYKDPFWKSLEPPSDDKTSEEKSDGTEERSRRKRSLDNYQGQEYSTLFDVSPFDDAWNIPTIEDDALDTMLGNNDLENNSLQSFRRRRRMLDNFIVKERPQERYPLGSDHVAHKVLVRPKITNSQDLADYLSKSQQSSPNSDPQIMLSPVAKSSAYSYQQESPEPSSSMNVKRRTSGDAPVTLSDSQLRAIQETFLGANGGAHDAFSFPEAAVSSIADSFALPLKQVYEMFIDFIKKIVVVAL